MADLGNLRNMAQYYGPLFTNTTLTAGPSANNTYTTRIPTTSLRAQSDTTGEDFKQITRYVYVLILVIGIPGNILTCYIIITTKFMRRSIHFYTFNLAASDTLVVLIYVPFEMVRNENDLRWILGIEMCHASYLLVPFSLISSIFTLVAVTLDRHRGVTQPLLWRGDTTRITRAVIPLIWLSAIILAAPPLAFVKLDENPARSGQFYCTDKWTDKTAQEAYWILIFCVQVPIPLLIIIVCNINMLRVMTRSETSIHSQHNKRMIGMVFLLVLIYAVCTSPQQIFYFWATYGGLQRTTWSETFLKASNQLVICQSAINPIIYGTIRQDLNRSFKKMLYRFKCFNDQDKSRPRLGTDANLSFVAGTLSVENGHHASPAIQLRGLLEQNYTDTPPLPRFSGHVASLISNNNDSNSDYCEKSFDTVKRRNDQGSHNRSSVPVENGDGPKHLKDRKELLSFHERLENNMEEIVKILRESNETKL